MKRHLVYDLLSDGLEKDLQITSASVTAQKHNRLPGSTQQPRKLLLLAAVAVVQSLSCVRLFVSRTAWTAAHQVSLSSVISQSLLKFMAIESVMPSKHLILCHPLLPLPSTFPSTRGFSNESALAS